VKEDSKSFKLFVTENVPLIFEFSMSIDPFLLVEVRLRHCDDSVFGKLLNWPIENVSNLNSCFPRNIFKVNNAYDCDNVVFSEFIKLLKNFERERSPLC